MQRYAGRDVPEDVSLLDLLMQGHVPPEPPGEEEVAEDPSAKRRKSDA